MITDAVAKSFYSKVDKRGPDECWPWKGANVNGYGTLSDKRATHIALELSGHPRPGRLFALHSCDNPPCVNPAHLRWGTAADNSADCLSRGRHSLQQRTHCAKGHELVRLHRSFRECVICRREADREAYARKRALADARFPRSNAAKESGPSDFMRLPAYRVAQNEMVVARVECINDAAARQEIDRYAAVYSQDGPVLVQQRIGKRWVALYILAPARQDSEQPAKGGEAA
ncbi:MAG: hypothetical protein ACRYGI_11565 [Janthinobacterium lividum]